MSDSEQHALPIMLGTAGHVDHGKTSLVRALTDWETDTHKEEKERGVTIDFGVAPFRLDDSNGDDSNVCGIIDVPGHVDYIRNMVAGASAVDFLLLVVAADDSVMPQTREHMEIAALLGVQRVVVVLTKCDLVDKETVELAALETQEWMQELGFGDVPLFRVSSQTGEGIPELREFLVREVTAFSAEIEADSEAAPFRMFVRRAFTMKGFGTVVTGVPLSGRVSVGDSLELVPGGQKLGVRTIHNYRSEVTEARTHISCAINLRDVSPETFVRGMALISPGMYSAQRSLLVYCKNVSDSPIEPTNKDRVFRLHAGTAAIPARVRGVVEVGAEGFLEVHTFRPIVLTPGDRIVLRTLSTSVTLGGALVLACAVEPKTSFLDETRNPICHEAVEQGDMLSAYFFSAPSPVVSLTFAAQYCQQSLEALKKECKKRVSKNQLIALDEDRYLVTERLGEFSAKSTAVLRRYHKANAESLGMRDLHFCEVLGLPKNSFGRIWQHLQKLGELKYESGYVSLLDFAPSISKQEIALQEKLLKLLETTADVSIARGNIIDTLGVAEKELKKTVKRLIETGRIYAVGGSLISSSRLEQVEAAMRTLFESHEVLDLKVFRDSLGLSRNTAVEILEHFDSRGLTKRQGSGRVLAQRR